MSKRAVAYMRISQDKDGTEFGVGTQRTHILGLIKARGWELVEEYTDNSVSASKTRGKGTAWAKMLDAAERKEFDVIVAVDLDRLLRQTKDLVTLIETGAKIVTVDGQLDLSSASGEFQATVLTGIARFEVRRKAERTKRANQQRREQGIPIMGARVIGYSKDGLSLVDDEAEAVREAFDGFLNGVSMYRIARDLNDKGYRTSKGREFSNISTRYLLENARYAGLIRHYETGELYPGNFPAIVSEDVWRAAVEKIKDPARRTQSSSKIKWLLSGLAYCGRCGSRNIRVGKSSNGQPNYRCNDKPHLARLAAPIDELVNAVIVARLSRDDAASLFAPTDDVDVDGLRRDRAVAQSKLDGLASLFADGVLTESSVRSKSAELRKELNDIDTKLKASNDSIIADIASADDVESAWWSLDIERRRLVFDALMTVTILPKGRGGSRAFDPNLIRIEPK